MKTILTAAGLALAIATTAAAQPPAAAPAAPPAAAAPAAPAAGPSAAARLTVEKTPISEIIKNPKARAALEKAVPTIADYYEQIGGYTLAELAPMSQGALTPESLKTLQAEFDKL